MATQIAIRQSGGANIVSIPKSILKTLGLTVGSSLDLSIKGSKIILTPIVEEELTLEALMAGSPKENLVKTEEDLVWINDRSVGKEIF